MENHKQKMARIRKQRHHRAFNTVSVAIVLVISLLATAVASVAYLRDPASQTSEAYHSEVNQLIVDEGLRYKVYKDKLGKRTIGFGHLMTKEDKFTKLTSHEAIALLKFDYLVAFKSVERLYPWAEADVKLILTNMTFQMGSTGVSKFSGMLAALEAKEYQKAAGEILDSRYASNKQTPLRARRLAGRILQLEATWW